MAKVLLYDIRKFSFSVAVNFYKNTVYSKGQFSFLTHFENVFVWFKNAILTPYFWFIGIKYSHKSKNTFSVFIRT